MYKASGLDTTVLAGARYGTRVSAAQSPMLMVSSYIVSYLWFSWIHLSSVTWLMTVSLIRESILWWLEVLREVWKLARLEWLVINVAWVTSQVKPVRQTHLVFVHYLLISLFISLNSLQLSQFLIELLELS